MAKWSVITRVKASLLAVDRRDWLVAVFLFLLVAATSWTLFRPAFFRVHDYVHGARIAELTRSAQAGHLPVRWTENFGFGYGMPLFAFYAPLPYYVGGLAYWLSGDLVLASKLVFIIPNIGAVLGSYLLGKELYGRKGGVIVAAAYALAPYRAVNLFVRGAVGESWGMMAMPFALWAGIVLIRKLAAQKVGKSESKKESMQSVAAPQAWWYLVVSLAVLFLSHNLSTLMYVPVSLLVLGLLIWQHSSSIRSAIQLAWSAGSAYLLAIGLTAFYLFPALLEKNATIIDSILSGYFYFSHHFLYIRQFLTPNWGYGGSAWGPDDGLSFFLGYGQLLAAIVSGLTITWYTLTVVGLITNGKNHSLYWKTTLVALRKKILTAAHFQLFVLFGLVVAGALFLTLLKSQFLWETVPLIAFIQFPWRWLSIAILFLALVAGYAPILIRDKRTMQIVVVGLVTVICFNIPYFQPESYLGRNEDFYYSDPVLIRTQMSSILPDYIPVQMRLAELQPKESSETTENGEKEIEGETIAPLLPTNAQGAILTPESVEIAKDVAILVNRPHQKLLSVNLVSPETITFAVANFPGWTAEVDGQPADVLTANTGLIQVEVPAGQHTVGIYLGSTPIRLASDMVSFFSLLVVLYMIAPLSKRATKN